MKISLREFFLIPAAIAAVITLAPPTQARAQEQIEQDGVVDVVIEENIRTGTHRLRYYLRDEAQQRWRELNFDREPPTQIRTGMRVRIRGRARENSIDVQTVEPVEVSPSPVAPLPVDQTVDQLSDAHRAVVLIVDLKDATASSRYSPQYVTGKMWTDADSVANFYDSASFGQNIWPADSDGDGAPDVFGPFKINYSKSSCDYMSWASAAESAAAAAGVNLSLYKHRVFVLPRYNYLSCGWSGLANVGCSSYCRAWIAEGESTMVYTHELGHNLNLAHAGTDPGNDGTIDSEYGDYSDPMGINRSAGLFNAPHFDQLGWYAAYPGSVQTVLSSGTYRIAAIGSDPLTAGAPVMLKLSKADSGDFYYLSYREGAGWDASLSSTYTKGVNVHRYKGKDYNQTAYIKTLSDGQTFSDDKNSIDIRQVSSQNGYATVDIDFDLTCASASPKLDLSPGDLAGNGSMPAKYSVTVTNRDGAGCRTSTFALGYDGEPAASFSPSSLTIAPGDSRTATLSVSTGGEDGKYTLNVSADNGVMVTSGSATLQIDGTPPGTPYRLTAGTWSANKISLRWSPYTWWDGGTKFHYIVYRNGVEIAEVTSTSYTDAPTESGKTYSYQVQCVDEAGNASQLSDPLAVTSK